MLASSKLGAVICSTAKKHVNREDLSLLREPCHKSVDVMEYHFVTKNTLSSQICKQFGHK